MATDIVSGLFGVNPAALQRARQEAAFAEDYKSVQLSPIQQGNLMLRQGARALGEGLAPLLGGQDPEMAKATMARQLASQFDITSAEGLRGYASALAQNGAPDLAQLAIQRANQLTTSDLATQKTQMDITAAERKITQDEKLREALAALPANATEEQYLAVFRQFGSPDQQARVIQQIINNKARIAARAGEEDTVGTAGPVGKTGAFRDINGVVYGPAEMKTIRGEFKGAQDLLDTLNKVSAQDIKNAESFVDWTTKSSEVKSLAQSKTLTAQSKIAASQLLEQINSLPPGSASDADMRAAMKNFPGYSDPVALQNWVNETKGKLQRSLTRISDQFGFKPTVTSSGNIDLKAKPAAQGQGTAANPIKLD